MRIVTSTDLVRHRISIDENYRGRANLRTLPRCRSVINVSASVFGGEFARYYSLSSKLSYLVTVYANGQVPLGDPHTVTEELAFRRPEFSAVRELVLLQTGCDLHIVPGSAGFVPPQCRDTASFITKIQASLANFLFAPNSFLETSTTRILQPQMWHSDRGGEDIYERFYAEPPENSTRVKIKLLLDEGLGPRHVELSTGLRINASMPLARELCDNGAVESALWCSSAKTPAWLGVSNTTDAVMACLSDFSSGFGRLRNLSIAIKKVTASPASPINELQLTLICWPSLARSLQRVLPQPLALSA